MKQITCPHCGDSYPDFDVAHVCSKGLYAPKLKPKMNERIKELYLHAFPPSLNDSTLCRMSAEKFAELIVKECMSLVSEPGPDMNDTERGILAQIKHHFGVEE